MNHNPSSSIMGSNPGETKIRWRLTTTYLKCRRKRTEKNCYLIQKTCCFVLRNLHERDWSCGVRAAGGVPRVCRHHHHGARRHGRRDAEHIGKIFMTSHRILYFVLTFVLMLCKFKLCITFLIKILRQYLSIRIFLLNRWTTRSLVLPPIHRPTTTTSTTTASRTTQTTTTLTTTRTPTTRISGGKLKWRASSSSSWPLFSSLFYSLAFSFSITREGKRIWEISPSIGISGTLPCYVKWFYFNNIFLSVLYRNIFKQFGLTTLYSSVSQQVGHGIYFLVAKTWFVSLWESPNFVLP